MMSFRMLSVTAMCVCASLSPSQAADIRGLEPGTPEMKSATVLAFGPEDILFVGDAKAATVFAIATGDTQGDVLKKRRSISITFRRRSEKCCMPQMWISMIWL